MNSQSTSCITRVIVVIHTVMIFLTNSDNIFLDVLIAGNLYNSEVETPRNDASKGLFLKGNGSGAFTPIKSLESGFFTPGDVKDMVRINVNGKSYIIVAKNSDYIQFVSIPPTTISKK